MNESNNMPNNGVLTVCIAGQKHGQLQATERFDLDRLWILDPDVATSVEITGSDLSRTDDRIMLEIFFLK